MWQGIVFKIMREDDVLSIYVVGKVSFFLCEFDLRQIFTVDVAISARLHT